MPWVDLKYTSFSIPPSDPFPLGQTVQRPLLALRLSAGDKSLDCIACVDSGADHCVFPLSFALALGLNPLTMKRQNTAGVGSAANTTFYQHVAVDWGNGPFSCYAGFTGGS